ncbi:SUKH-4 family immunity protein [Streptomyces sp. NPDC046821]|uniref:SUKH-4 family immunity protein n=1 Tax=Streptomyces sp. NPDC046821 TaxID=3154702 RepID=UPI0033CB359B
MLFEVTRSELLDIFGEDRLATLPAIAFPPAGADTEGARLLQTVGAPTGTSLLREPDAGDGRLPLVQDVVETEGFEDAHEDERR